jgi:hypothetical protein
MNREAFDTSLRPPNGEAPIMPRTIDLYGRALDGRPLLWKRAVPVVPTKTFERNGRWIQCGHYIINYNGDAIVVHCANMRDESVSVQFIYQDLTPYSLPRRMVETMLLGKVVMSEEQQAAVFERSRLSDFFH